MTAILILTVLALLALAATVHDLRTDGRGFTPPPTSHGSDPDSIPPAQRLSYR